MNEIGKIVLDFFDNYKFTKKQEKRLILFLELLEIKKVINFKLYYSITNAVIIIKDTKKWQYTFQIDENGDSVCIAFCIKNNNKNKKFIFEYEKMTCEEIIKIINNFIKKDGNI